MPYQMLKLIPDISGGMAGALNFTNIKLNIFGCELSPNVATSDFYTFCSGGDGSAQDNCQVNLL